MTTPVTYSNHLQRWQIEGDIMHSSILEGKIYVLYAIIILFSFVIALIVANFCGKINERRIIVVFIGINICSLIFFADYKARMQIDQVMYTMGFTLLALTNMFIEASSVSYLMKTLAQESYSKSQVFNAGFYLEFIEVASKILTIGLLIFGNSLQQTSEHNFLIIVFSIWGTVLLGLAIKYYGKMMVKHKKINENYY